MAEEFYTCVTSADIAASLNVDADIVDVIEAYWILKRRVCEIPILHTTMWTHELWNTFIQVTCDTKIHTNIIDQ